MMAALTRRIPLIALSVAALIVSVARPRTEKEAHEIQVWVKRLQGGRS